MTGDLSFRGFNLFGVPARNAVVQFGHLFNQGRFFTLAAIGGEPASRMEAATRKYLSQVGNTSGDRVQPLRSWAFDARYRCQQADRVGVSRVIENILDGAFFHHFAGL